MTTVAQPVSSVTVPTGTVIEFHTAPKRKYTINGVEVPSVTEVLDCLDKKGLPWWGQTIGITAIDTLIDLGLIVSGTSGNRRGFFEPNGDHILTIPELTAIVTRTKLTVNHVRDTAGDRGTAVHDALEAWCAIGKVPTPSDYPHESTGHVEALAAFLRDASSGGLTAEMFEVSVGSAEHGYAGRFDLLARTTNDMRVAAKVYPVWPSKYTTVPAGSRILVDLKTSRSVYESHLLQLGGYEIALEESGYGKVDARAVLHVMDDGRYEFKRARGEPTDFLAVLACSLAVKRMREALKT
jgi:hypothetical protein